MPDPVRQFLLDGKLAALHPTLGQLCEYVVAPEDFENAKKKGPGRLRELCFVVPQVLREPTAIYKGLPDRGKAWLCYAGVPDRAYDYTTGQRVPPWPGEVFLVYINQGLFVYNWRWECADSLDPTVPVDDNGQRFEARKR